MGRGGGASRIHTFGAIIGARIVPLITPFTILYYTFLYFTFLYFRKPR